MGRYACRRLNVSALGTLIGTTGKLRFALRLEGRERGRGGRGGGEEEEEEREE